LAGGLDASDERVRELAADILAREEYAAFRVDLEAWKGLLGWLADWAAWLENLRVASPALYGLLLAGLLFVALVLLAHVVWTVSLALRMPPPATASSAAQPGPGLLDQAESLAREGRFLEAARRVELATLALLLEERVIELARSEPNRVLRRRLRAAPLPAAERRQLLGLLDRLESGLFRDRLEDPELYAGWRALHRRVASLPGAP
jgi:hypothetical protein